MCSEKLKKWEIALLLSLLLCGSLGSTPCYGWWGVIFPELGGYCETVQETASFEGERLPTRAGEKTQIRFRSLELLQELKQRWS